MVGRAIIIVLVRQSNLFVKLMCVFASAVWSNFEIADLDFWRGEAYTKFFDHLDAKGVSWFPSHVVSCFIRITISGAFITSAGVPTTCIPLPRRYLLARMRLYVSLADSAPA